MGIYLNPDNIDFREALNSEIYVDKTGLIALTNKVIRTEQKYVCVSRPRRFGKSVTANMLTAYYSRGCDSGEMFQDYKISASKSFREHLNQYHVIRINMAEFSHIEEIGLMVGELEKALLFDLTEEFTEVKFFDSTNLVRTLKDVYTRTKIPFIFIIDEWDCIFREHKEDIKAQSLYLDFLRNLMKNQSYIALAYMTGILPIKKYGAHSALNMFTEVSMTDPREYGEFTGFTEPEVMVLCERYHMPFEEVKQWYDGYNLMGTPIYNPRSVVMSFTGGYFNNYWTSTETYEALKVYISMDFDGLNQMVTRLIAGEEIEINPTKFQNDMTTFHNADDILTLLVHLGYLTFDFYTKKVRIPNREVAGEFINSIEDGGWEHVIKSIKSSRELLDATLRGDSDLVAESIADCHRENTSVLKYNDENSLACVICLAYYAAREKYEMWRELPAGEGFADMVFLPRKNVNLPAILVELKRDKSAGAAIEQIERKHYPDKLKEYSGEIFLVGINYDSKEKIHTCEIHKSNL